MPTFSPTIALVAIAICPLVCGLGPVSGAREQNRRCSSRGGIAAPHAGAPSGRARTERSSCGCRLVPRICGARPDVVLTCYARLDTPGEHISRPARTSGTAGAALAFATDRGGTYVD